MRRIRGNIVGFLFRALWCKRMSPTAMNMSPSIVLDTREVALSYFMQNVPVQQLLVGDCQIVNEDQSIAFVFERKTLSDLGASIIDGRLKEQKQRLMSVVREPRQIVYIIEGSKNGSVIPKDTLVHTTDSLQLRDGFTVVFTDNQKHTSDVILAVFKRHCEELYTFNTDKDYLSCVKVRKCDNVKDSLSCALLMLATVPHVTTKSARVIMNTYNATSMHDLVTTMGTRDEVVRVLANSMCGLRKLGPVLAGCVWDALHC